MERIRDDFLDTLEVRVPLKGKMVLEVGCGKGIRSATIAKRCHWVVGIDTNPAFVKEANDAPLLNANFLVRSAAKMGLPPATYDVVIFALSLHEISTPLMPRAIDEAVRVVKPNGYIVFLEPGFWGFYFDAEIQFGAGDGDETKEKKAAQVAIARHSRLRHPAELEFTDETVFRFANTQDFIAHLHPKKNLHKLDAFLRTRDFILKAVRHTHIFKPRQ